MKQIPAVILGCILFSATLKAQSPELLLKEVQQKLSLVNDYEATGRMKTNVAFLKVPVANVKVYYKKPDQLRIKNEKGISFIPKGAVNLNMAALLRTDQYTVLDAGIEKIGKTSLRVIKLLPLDDNSDVVLSTLFIEEASKLIYKSKTTTKENGTFELEFTYGDYARYGLPDKIIFSFNTRDYKLPKGVTFDFDDGSQSAPKSDELKNKKGRAEIVLRSYQINKGLKDEIFR